MTKNFTGEKWAEVQFDFVHTNEYRLQVSNFGRVKSFNKNSNDDILNGTAINGYRIIRLKFFKPREERLQKKIIQLQKKLSSLKKEIRILTKEHTAKKVMSEKEAELKAIRKQLNKVLKEDRKLRTINYHGLIHRLVAAYFLPKPEQDETKVAHLDYDKLNNRVENLKWMTPEENYQHQQKSPLVILEKQQRALGLRQNIKVAKLSVTKVMLLKKLINNNKPMKLLIKQFKITDTQILRIKRGENWKHIPAAN